jgi:hypothetical protein
MPFLSNIYLNIIGLINRETFSIVSGRDPRPRSLTSSKVLYRTKNIDGQRQLRYLRCKIVPYYLYLNEIEGTFYGASTITKMFLSELYQNKLTMEMP